MKPEEAKGSISAEWVEHRPPGVKGCSEDPENERVILFLHGGGFIMGSPLSHRCLTSRFAELAGAKVLAIDYRLAPEHTFPLPLHDAISAYLSLVDPPQTSLSGGKPPKRYRADQIFIAGDSAGGGLSLALSLWLRDYGLNASNPNPLWRQPGGIVALAPWVDLTHSQPSFRLNALIDYLPENVTDPEHIVPGVRSHAYTRTDADNIHPYVSPMFGTDNPIRLTGRTDDDKATLLPPTLIQVGERERLRDEGIVLAAKSFSNSPIRLELYRDMVHVFQVFGDPVGEVALRRAGDFIRNLSVKKTTDAVDEPITSHPSSPGFLGIAPDGEVTELGRVAMMQIVEDGKAEVEVMERKKTIAAEAAAAASWWPLAARGAQTVKPPVALTAAASSIWMGTATRFAGAEDLMGRTEMRMRLPLYRAV
ncbi:Alpha/Beta hydrolase protein [Chytridium lagenaria]|nr:Alpha/Beta hydrolase protein [Chytridium lagenaria]